MDREIVREGEQHAEGGEQISLEFVLLKELARAVPLLFREAASAVVRQASDEASTD